MDTQSKENVAIAKVSEFISKSSGMQPYLNTQDKIPVWDGEIMLYRDGKETVKGLFGWLSVQVKGTTGDFPPPDSISFSLKYKYLSSYRLKPTVLFVVTMDEKGDNFCLYIHEFFLQELNELLREYTDKDAERIKSVRLEKVTERFLFAETDSLLERLKRFYRDFSRQERVEKGLQNIDQILMPIHPQFRSIYGKFMDKDDLPNERAYSVSRYMEGIIDLFLKNQILNCLTDEALYDGLSLNQKVEALKVWDSELGGKFSLAMETGNQAKNIWANVPEPKVRESVDIAIHIVEDLFIRYFLKPAHKFGSEPNVLFFLSILPLNNRIYILKALLEKETNPQCRKFVIDKLSLAYIKNGQAEQAETLLRRSLTEGEISDYEYGFYMNRNRNIAQALPNVQAMNPTVTDRVTGKYVSDRYGTHIIVGHPSNKNIVDVKCVCETLDKDFPSLRRDYPEFAHLFLALIRTDQREYQ